MFIGTLRLQAVTSGYTGYSYLVSYILMYYSIHVYNIYFYRGREKYRVFRFFAKPFF